MPPGAVAFVPDLTVSLVTQSGKLGPVPGSGVLAFVKLRQEDCQ